MTVLPRAGIIAVFLLAGSPSAAQNMGGVFGPVVDEGHRSIQYRNAYDLDSHGFAQRLHYQHALTGDSMLRIKIQAHKTPASRTDTDFVQGELFWQLADISDRWQHGLRFDVRVRTEGRPVTLGLNWTNQLEFGDRWQARFLVMTGIDVGEGAAGDVLLQTRASVYRAASDRLRLGVELYSAYGALDEIPSFDAQRHQAGPALVARIGAGWQLYSGVLFGLSGAAADTQARIRLTRAL